jgi:hypothetical protein
LSTKENMKYAHLEEAGTLSLLYDGPLLDLLTLGTMQIEMQGMADRVATALLAREGLVDVDRPWLMFRKPQPFIRQRSFGRVLTDEPVPVRLVSRRIRCESPLEQDLIFLVPAILADPDVRAVLQGIAGNIVTSVAASGIRGLKSLCNWGTSRSAHPVDLGPEVRRLAMALARNANGQHARLTVVHSHGDQKFEVELTIEPHDD